MYKDLRGERSRALVRSIFNDIKTRKVLGYAKMFCDIDDPLNVPTTVISAMKEASANFKALRFSYAKRVAKETARIERIMI